jgi:hypothetical protein
MATTDSVNSPYGTSRADNVHEGIIVGMLFCFGSQMLSRCKQRKAVMQLQCRSSVAPDALQTSRKPNIVVNAVTNCIVNVRRSIVVRADVSTLQHAVCLNASVPTEVRTCILMP